ncbi:MAG: peptidoglycan editing factor PgeF [Methylobacter sp.]|nr:peptidoglycan editing factor PgeF [Methylobacter sp.]
MSGIKHWLTPDWPAPANIRAATTLRTGGVSCGAYASLNPAMHVGDDADKVKQNRQIIKELLGLPGEPVWLDQIHSNRAVQAHPPLAKGGRGDLDLQQADAGYTAESGVVCAVMTADCLPLLVCATDGSQVAAIHAGWRGLLAGVIGNTLAALQIPLAPLLQRGARGDFLVWLGPAIGPDCFEVGAEVRNAFLEKSAAFITAFKQQSNDKWLADIYQLARIDLAMLGIDKVYGGGFCTVTEHERFYSYRRDKETGRMATLIWRA